MIKSSAYNSEFLFFAFGRANGSDNVFSNKYGKLFIKRFKLKGAKQPICKLSVLRRRKN